MENMFVSSTENGNENYMDARCEKASMILGTLPESQSQKSADDDFDVSSLFIS